MDTQTYGKMHDMHMADCSTSNNICVCFYELLKVYVSLHSFKPGKGFRSWLV